MESTYFVLVAVSISRLSLYIDGLFSFLNVKCMCFDLFLFMQIFNFFFIRFVTSLDELVDGWKLLSNLYL